MGQFTPIMIEVKQIGLIRGEFSAQGGHYVKLIMVVRLRGPGLRVDPANSQTDPADFAGGPSAIVRISECLNLT